MALGFLKNILDTNAKEIKRYTKIVDKINHVESVIANMTDRMMRERTYELKKRYQEGQSLDSMLPEAFAMVREASKRVLGMRHFDGS
jgi:preprotein translocase subunit SecA